MLNYNRLQVWFIIKWMDLVSITTSKPISCLTRPQPFPIMPWVFSQWRAAAAPPSRQIIVYVFMTSERVGADSMQAQFVSQRAQWQLVVVIVTQLSQQASAERWSKEVEREDARSMNASSAGHMMVMKPCLQFEWWWWWWWWIDLHEKRSSSSCSLPQAFRCFWLVLLLSRRCSGVLNQSDTSLLQAFVIRGIPLSCRRSGVCNQWYLSLSGVLGAAGEDDRHAAEGEVGRPADRSADSGSETC